MSTAWRSARVTASASRRSGVRPARGAERTTRRSPRGVGAQDLSRRSAFVFGGSIDRAASPSGARGVSELAAGRFVPLPSGEGAAERRVRGEELARLCERLYSMDTGVGVEDVG